MLTAPLGFRSGVEGMLTALTESERSAAVRSCSSLAMVWSGGGEPGRLKDDDAPAMSASSSSHDWHGASSASIRIGECMMGANLPKRLGARTTG